MSTVSMPCRPALCRQVQDFAFTFTPEIYAEMSWLARLSHRPVWKVLVWAREKGIVELQLILAVGQNVMLVLRYSSLHYEVEALELILGISQLIVSSTVFAAHAGQNAFRGPRELIKDTELLFLTIAFAASFLGLTVSPLFFCVHLLDIANKSPDLQAANTAAPRGYYSFPTIGRTGTA